MASIGIMGGTFNPIHIGHIEIAKAAYEQFPLDEIWFMPNHTPAYKSDEELVSGQHRMAMIALAIQGIPHFRTDDFELKREGPTYTAETFNLLKKQYPSDTFYFIMGADSLDYFEKWKQPEDIVHAATVLVAPRGTEDASELQDKIDKLNDKYGRDSFERIECRQIPCSSSEIRKRLQQKEPARPGEETTAEQLYVPDSVYNYIMENHLYR